MDISKAAASQPNPLPGVTEVYPYVIQDIKDRVEMGRDKYGTTLKTQNGRDALWDAYTEALDLVFYLRQELLEGEGK